MTYQNKRDVGASRGNAEYAIRPNNDEPTSANSLLNDMTDVNGSPHLAGDLAQLLAPTK